jgi:hypothetical protein
MLEFLFLMGCRRLAPRDAVAVRQGWRFLMRPDVPSGPRPMLRQTGFDWQLELTGSV